MSRERQDMVEKWQPCVVWAGLVLILFGTVAGAAQRSILRDLAYVPNGHERQKLDLYLPADGTAAPVPVIIWVHGGAWLAGSKDRCPAQRFVDAGYAVASINYRLSQHATFPAQIQDCKAAVR